MVQEALRLGSLMPKRCMRQEPPAEDLEGQQGPDLLRRASANMHECRLDGTLGHGVLR